MIRKLLIVLILSMVTLLPSPAKSVVSTDSITARRAFVEMPATVLDLLSKSSRLDMLDFFDVDSIYRAVNALEGFSYLEKVTPDYLKVVVTPVSTLQFKILKDKKGNELVMTIYTVGGESDAKDSDIRFFNAELEELDRSKLLKLPLLKDYFNIPRGDKTALNEIEQLVPFSTVEFEAAPASNIVTGKLTVGNFMSQEDYGIVRRYERSGISLVWDGKTLSPVR